MCHPPRVVRPSSEHRLTLDDGTELFYRAWLPAGPVTQSLVLLHRGHEHSGRLADIAQALADDNTAVFAWDARGHGQSTGARGWAPSFAELARDLDAFVKAIECRHGVTSEDLAIIAHSVGAVVATAWVHDYAPEIRALVLVTPAFKVKLYVPFARPLLRLVDGINRRLLGGRKIFVKSYVKARLLTHDAAEARRYDADPLITRDIAVNVLVGMDQAARRLAQDAGAIRVPTLVLSGGADWVVDKYAQRRFFARLGSPVKKMREFAGMYHDILHESDRRQVIAEIRHFLAETRQQERRQPLIDADRGGYTRDEYDRLQRPLPAASPQRWLYAVERLGLATAGRLSQGIRLGWRRGFDSGESLDYVYRNRARGAFGIGRLIDRVYLDSPGWRGIRQRKLHLEKLLHYVIEQESRSLRPAHIVDIAAGPGRYLLETLARYPNGKVTARLRDNKPANLAAGRKLATELDVEEASFELGDAFDGAALARLEPSPNVAVISGLFELIPENRKALTALTSLAQAMDGDGWLIYTGQPWHPQLEMIARVLTNREGEPWVMRRRTQEELDDLVRAAGFRKIAMEIDDDGIFTVSVARLDATRSAIATPLAS